MRTIKQFSEMLASILFGVRSRGEELSLVDLEELSVSFSGFSLPGLIKMDSAQLISLFSVTGDLDVNKAYSSAMLLHTLAKQEDENALMLKPKALDLFVAVYDRLGNYLNGEHEDIVVSLKREFENS